MLAEEVTQLRPESSWEGSTGACGYKEGLGGTICKSPFIKVSVKDFAHRNDLI